MKIKDKKKRRHKIPRKSSYKFSDKTHSKLGILSSVLGMACLASAVSLIIISGESAGNGTLILGLLGDIVMIITVIGLVISIKSFKEKDIYYTYSIIGTFLNGIVLLTLFALFVTGL